MKADRCEVLFIVNGGWLKENYRGKTKNLVYKMEFIILEIGCVISITWTRTHYLTIYSMNEVIRDGMENKIYSNLILQTE